MKKVNISLQHNALQKNKWPHFIFFALIAAMLSASASASPLSPTFKESFAAHYKPCELQKPSHTPIQNDTQGLDLLEPVDLSHCPTYGVLLKGPVAALTPHYLFTQYHERLWRKTNVTYPDTLDKGREDVDHWLQPGTVLAFYKGSVGSSTIHTQWISVDKFTPSEKPKREKVEMGIELNFRLPSGWQADKDQEKIFTWLSQWMSPFASLDEANRYAQTAFTGTTKPNPIANDIHIIDLSHQKQNPTKGTSGPPISP